MVITTRKSHLNRMSSLPVWLVPFSIMIFAQCAYADVCTTWSFHGGGSSSSGRECFPDLATCQAAIKVAGKKNGDGETFGGCVSGSGSNSTGSATTTSDPNAMVTQGLGNAMAGAMTNDPTRFGSGLGQVGAGLVLETLFGGPTPQEQARAAQIAQAQRQEAEQRAAAELQAEQLRLEQQRQRLLGMMKALDSDRAEPSSDLKSDGGTQVGGQSNFFGIGSATGVQLKPIDSADNANQIAMANTPATGTASPAGITAGAADKAPAINPGPSGSLTVGGMKLKDIDGESPPRADSTPVIALGQTVALIPRSGDPEHLAPGERVVDCKATRQFYVHLAKGMPMQRDWLDKLQEQLADAHKERREQYEQTREMIKEDTIGTLKDLMWQSDVLRAELNGLNKTGMSLEKRKALVHALNLVNEVYDGADLGKKTIEAGEPYAEALIERKPETYGDYSTGRLLVKKTSLSDKTTALFKFLADSDLLAEEGKSLSEKLGPQALMLFTIAKLDIDVWSNVYGEQITAAQYEQAKQNESTLREQINKIDGQLKDAMEDLNQYCKSN